MVRAYIIAALVALGVAILGGAMTDVGPWYQALKKSPLNPPEWAFAPAWTVIYALAVITAVEGWRAASSHAERSWLIILYFFNAVLNIAWSALFFTVRRPDWALAQVIVLWLSVLALVIFLSRLKTSLGALLAPYLIWVAYAAYLNFEVVRLNGPFG